MYGYVLPINLRSVLAFKFTQRRYENKSATILSGIYRIDSNETINNLIDINE